MAMIAHFGAAAQAGGLVHKAIHWFVSVFSERQKPVPVFHRAFAHMGPDWRPMPAYAERKPRMGLTPARSYRFLAVTPALRANFERFGAVLGAETVEEYFALAQEFLEVALRPDAIGYTFIQLKSGDLAVDYKGEVRGVYSRHGIPQSFFKPDYQGLGYRSAAEEIEAWKRRGKLLPSLALH